MAQVFGSAFAALIAMVTAATWVGAGAAALAAGSAFFLSMALFTGLNRQAWTRRKVTITAVAVVAGLGLACAAVITGAANRQTPGANSPGTSSSSIMSKSGYRLVPSSDPLSNEGDKVDLDTGCPGWGPTSLKVGRNRCGDLADLIVETDEVHTPNHAPRLAPLNKGEQASYDVCRNKMTNANTAIGAVDAADLRGGTQFCVLTDKDNIAAVRVDSVTGENNLVITFEVWKS